MWTKKVFKHDNQFSVIWRQLHTVGEICWINACRSHSSTELLEGIWSKFCLAKTRKRRKSTPTNSVSEGHSRMSHVMSCDNFLQCNRNTGTFPEVERFLFIIDSIILIFLTNSQ